MYYFDVEKQYFKTDEVSPTIPDLPLTVTLQINRKCNLKCIYCSEYNQISDLSLENAIAILEKLKGVKRVIISGGEPLLHKDLFPILSYCRSNFEVVALATNATLITSDKAQELVKYIDYFDVTIDGTRAIHDSIRGNFDGVIQGLLNLKSAGGKLSIVTVLYNKNKSVLPYILSFADIFGAEKLKVLSPIPKGRGVAIANDRPDQAEISAIFERLKAFKLENGIKTKIVMTSWDRIKEGHAILIHPDGQVVASPVWTKENCIAPIGNINHQSIAEIWELYPYKLNHINKYIEKTMLVG